MQHTSTQFLPGVRDVVHAQGSTLHLHQTWRAVREKPAQAITAELRHAPNSGKTTPSPN